MEFYIVIEYFSYIKTFKVSLIAILNMQYSIIKYSHQDVYYISMT